MSAGADFVWYAAARLCGILRPGAQAVPPTEPAVRGVEHGISVVIPSRNGRELLAAQLPGIAADLGGMAAEIIVVDNGSDDGTAAWLRECWPAVGIELSAEPLSFARAINRGLAAARYSHVCLLNNDMSIEPAFFEALLRPFGSTPDLFCASAQIRFPEGARREETGKTVLSQAHPEDFPVWCAEPLPGEDGTYVLYGSGGCSLYDAAKLRALGGIDEIYAPAYVEDLDLGYRAWNRGWPSVYAAGAVVEHRHRATTSRYYDPAELDYILERNYLRFLARAVCDRRLFRRLWKQATLRLRLIAPRSAAARRALREAAAMALGPRVAAPAPAIPEEFTLALTSRSAAFPGHAPTGRPRALVVVASHTLSALDAAELRARVARAAESDVALVALVDELAPPTEELLRHFVEVVVVRGEPCEAESPALRAALRLATRKWKPEQAWLDAPETYGADCAPARVNC